MNNNLKPITTLPPFKRLCMTIGELPTSYLETMTYYEMLVWFTEYMKNTIIPTINNNGLAVKELQDKYIELKTYVDNYFDNLDIQEEINNKLDEMVESGELERIINEEIFGELNNQVNENTKNISLLPLKVTPNVRRLGRFLIPYGNDKLSTDVIPSNYNLQGSCLTSSSTMIMMLINNDDTSATLKEFNFKNGQILRESTITYAGHGNGLHKIGDYLYIATYTNLIGTTIKKVRYDDLSEVATYNFDFPVKTIYQDETTQKVYIANDFSIYEWVLDTSTSTKLFDWSIPNFEINVDGTIQTIVVYKDMIYLLGCYDNSNNIVIFLIDKQGNLYTSYDLGSNNLSSYYGEGQDIMQDGDTFYMTSVFRLGSTLYNDYQINNVYTFNPFTQIHKDNYMSFLTPSTQRQINSNNTGFFADGTNTYPYRFYFEFALENMLTNQHLVGTISGGNQPLLYTKNERASYNVNGTTIEGIIVQNADLTINGSNNATIDTPYRRATHTEIQLIRGSRLTLLNCIVGNTTDNKNDYSIYADYGSILIHNGCTLNHNIPIYNVGGIIQNSSNIAKLEMVNVSRVNPQVIFIQDSGATDYVVNLSVGDQPHKIMTSSITRKYLQFHLRCGSNEMVAMSTGNTDLSNMSFTRIFPIVNNNNLYYVTITMSYDSTNKNFVISFDSVVDNTGASANKSVLGYCSAGLLMIV